MQEMWNKTREQEAKLDRIMAFLESERRPSRQQGTSSGGQTQLPQAMPIPTPAPVRTPVQAPVQVQDTVKMEAPDAFDGDRKKLRSFRTSVTIYFNVNPKHFGTHSNRIWWILSRVKGEVALNWRDNKVNAFNRGDWVPTTEQALWTEIEETFGDPDMQATQMMSLKTINQGLNTMDAHVAAFKIAARGSGYEGKPLIDEFLRSIDKRIRDHILMGQVNWIPTTIEGWCVTTTHLDRHWRNMKAMEKVYAQNAQPQQRWQAPRQANVPAPQAAAPQQPARPAAPAAAPRNNDVVPMDVDRAPCAPLVCYKCRKPGHIARNCRSRVDVRAMTWEKMVAVIKEDDAARFQNGNQ